MFSMFHSAFASTLQRKNGSQVLTFLSLDRSMDINSFGPFGVVWFAFYNRLKTLCKTNACFGALLVPV